MLKMSPFITFLLYCLFVSFTIYYLTKDKLDETSRYMLIGVLILPYIFMDQSESFSNIFKEKFENQDLYPEPLVPRPMPRPVTKQIIEQPKITLNEDEKVENLKAIEAVENNKKMFTSQEIQNLIKDFNNKKIIEDYGSVYTGEVEKTYNEDEKFTDQLLKPLGENGNGLTNAWDHDYILLNTDKWSPALNPPPVCKSEQSCPVCPNLTTGYPLMVRDFDTTRRITAPIKADVSSMNNFTSTSPTNAVTPPITYNDIKNKIESNPNPPQESFGKQINKSLSRVPASEKPMVISYMAKQMGMPEEALKMILNDPSAKI
jgi:hypothetical protein